MDKNKIILVLQDIIDNDVPFWKFDEDYYKIETDDSEKQNDFAKEMLEDAIKIISESK